MPFDKTKETPNSKEDKQPFDEKLNELSKAMKYTRENWNKNTPRDNKPEETNNDDQVEKISPSGP